MRYGRRHRPRPPRREAVKVAPQVPPVAVPQGPTRRAQPPCVVPNLALGALAGGEGGKAIPLPTPCSSLRILTAPDPKGLRELRGTLRRGQMDVNDFVSADGPSALLDVIAEVQCKPRLGWVDFELLDGALGALKELLNSAEGATSILDTEGALDRFVGLLGVGEVRVVVKALQLLSCLGRVYRQAPRRVGPPPQQPIRRLKRRADVVQPVAC